MTESVASFFDGLQDHIDVSKTSGITAVYQFNITGDGGGQWVVRLTGGKPEVYKGAEDKPDIMITAGATDWCDIISGRQSGQAAFLQGKIKVEGDISLAMLLQQFVS